MATTRQESQWVLRAQCGDRDALEQVLASVQPALRRYISGITGATYADDVLQDVLIVIARKLRWLDEPEVFRAWAYRIASRTALRAVQRARRQQHIETAIDSTFDVAALTTRPSDELLHALIDGEVLTPASRAVFLLHFQEELSLPEVAAILEIPLGTVKSRLAYGLAAARKHLSTTRS
ncbi:MAG: sigma-70 family RNA polymerase sigma factor [Vicinamibacterales bacterium]